jgi:tetratricopeptide (TPR) repeat protein
MELSMPAPFYLRPRAAQHIKRNTVGSLQAACLTLGFALAMPAFAQVKTSPSVAAPAASEIDNSKLDAALFYQLLIGEIELRSGEAGTAYQVLLDAARKSKDPQLFRRATDIALQGRAGDQALAAAAAWRTALPTSVEAHRYVIQLLVILNRVPETAEVMKSLLNVTPAPELVAQINGLPRFFSRAADRTAATKTMEQALRPYAGGNNPAAVQNAVAVTQGRGLLMAGDAPGALASAQRALAQDPTSEGAALLALEMMPGAVGAEALVQSYLKNKPQSDDIRIVYSRVLTSSQRLADALVQIEVVTRSQPQQAAPWLMQGALQLELRQPKDATASLTQFVSLTQADSNGATPRMQAAAASEDSDDAPPPDQGLTQAWLMLAQAAELQKDAAGAETWLAKITNPAQALAVQTRRASLLAKQGKVKEARELIRKTPELSENDGRAKVLAEVQLLRDQKMWAEAATLLKAANQKYADDIDLIYEESMIVEKLNRLDDMERLLRRVMVLKPDHQHAHNALGYSLAERNLRLPEAKALILKALEIAPGEPFITDSLGWVEYRLGNRAESLRLLRGAYQSRPDVEIAAHLGEVLWVNGEREEARRVLRDAKNRDATNEVLTETLARLKVDL